MCGENSGTLDQPLSTAASGSRAASVALFSHAAVLPNSSLDADEEVFIRIEQLLTDRALSEQRLRLPRPASLAKC